MHDLRALPSAASLRPGQARFSRPGRRVQVRHAALCEDAVAVRGIAGYLHTHPGRGIESSRLRLRFELDLGGDEPGEGRLVDVHLDDVAAYLEVAPRLRDSSSLGQWPKGPNSSSPISISSSRLTSPRPGLTVSVQARSCRGCVAPRPEALRGNPVRCGPDRLAFGRRLRKPELALDLERARHHGSVPEQVSGAVPAVRAPPPRGASRPRTPRASSGRTGARRSRRRLGA
jgi:hypothetical protein